MNKHDTQLCDCCEGVKYETPLQLSNDPGLTALLYRVGKHSHFKSSMIRGLSAQSALKALTNRTDDDASVAMIDAWAMVLDILTFYQERIINEGYLNTAKERLSLFELAKHISYRPKPGVAASTYLAFTMDDAVGTATEAIIEPGTKVQSIPGKDEKPQIFETLAPFDAKTRWNAIKPRLYRTETLRKSDKVLYLKGTNNQLNRGDAILIVGDERITSSGSERWDIRIINGIEIKEKENYTIVKWVAGLGHDFPLVNPAAEDQRVFVFRQRASLFGHNAPDVKVSTTESNTTITTTTQLEGYNDILTQTIDLDTVYPKIVQNSWVALVAPNYTELYRVEGVDNRSRAEFGLSAKVTTIDLDINENLHEFDRRNTNVLVNSEVLKMAETPITTIVHGNAIELDDDYPELAVGQHLILSGELEDTLSSTDLVPTSLNQAVIVSELIKVAGTEQVDGNTKIYLEKFLVNRYRRLTVTINANSITATHGETKMETLGSGDGSKFFQRFFLKQMPLTYISSSSINGTDTTLEIRVDDVLWKEVPTFYSRSAEERSYIVRQENDGTAYVQFGDGINGARLPTGIENVRATYRVGIGLEGLLKAKQLSMLMTPQLGLRSVVNPLATVDADAPELIGNIRTNAPLTVLTLDRIVSISDYEDFTRAFAGIGKAKADLMWQGEDRIVHLTVAGANAVASTVSQELIGNLSNAINSIRHDTYKVVVNNFDQITFSVFAKINVDPDYSEDEVVAKVTTQLMESFSFEQRRLGGNLTPSKIVSVIQKVPGVVYVDLDRIANTEIFSRSYFTISARAARWENQAIKPAELLVVNPDRISITTI